MSLDFRGSVALVTGAGNGLGREYAHQLAARGARVVVNDVAVGVDGRAGAGLPAHVVVEEIEAAGGVAVASTPPRRSAPSASAVRRSTPRARWASSA